LPFPGSFVEILPSQKKENQCVVVKKKESKKKEELSKDELRAVDDMMSAR